jgi:hypothetical protein
VARPGGLELPTFWFVAIRGKMLNALFGVAYGPEMPFFPQLAAPNVAPKAELYRTCPDAQSHRSLIASPEEWQMKAAPVPPAVAPILAERSCPFRRISRARDRETKVYFASDGVGATRVTLPIRKGNRA